MKAANARVFGNRLVSPTTDYTSRPTMIESLEERTFLSASPVLPPIAALTHGQGNHAGIIFQLLNQGNKGNPIGGDDHGVGHILKSIKGLNITVTNVQLQNGSLVVNGLIGNQPFSTTATLELPTAPAAGSLAASVVNAAAVTPILNLHLNAIHLNLLGLHVDTSDICLGIAAQSGPGNLLGNLLSSIAHLLDNNNPLGGILGGLSTTDLNTLLTGVTGLLNGALGNVLGGGTLGALATPALPPTATTILHLSLGPVDLNLLGLRVHLDNCANGPVTVDVTAVPGPGNLLGNLLSGVANLLNGSNNPLGQQVLNRIVGDVLSLL